MRFLPTAPNLLELADRGFVVSGVQQLAGQLLPHNSVIVQRQMLRAQQLAVIANTLLLACSGRASNPWLQKAAAEGARAIRLVPADW